MDKKRIFFGEREKDEDRSFIGLVANKYQV